ncbi:MAG: carcinine hydrolase/isopenicillin-N N-acyltransferase family protein [Magnetovibrionaceae bacterium]
MSELTTIPFMTADPLESLEAAPDRLATIIEKAEAHYGQRTLRIGDDLTRRWLAKTANPYRSDIEAVAKAVGRPGAIMLNMSYEWACTSGVNEPAGHPVLKRTLDWPLDGLGESLIVAARKGPAGGYLDVTWPGLVGVLTGLAKGRFAVVINQPPLKKVLGHCWLDWAIGRARLWRRKALPATHLLRQVFETCETFEEAKQRLIETPLALPAFFTLAGVRPGEACVIERTENSARLHMADDKGRVACANHYRAIPRKGHSRGNDSEGRLALMKQVLQGDAAEFSWLQKPILNPTTRLACVADPTTGGLIVQGFEKVAGEAVPATRIYRHSA